MVILMLNFSQTVICVMFSDNSVHADSRIIGDGFMSS